MIIRVLATVLVIWVALAWIRFCLAELDRFPPRYLNREAWVFLIIFTVPLGGICYFAIERGWRLR